MWHFKRDLHIVISASVMVWWDPGHASSWLDVTWLVLKWQNKNIVMFNNSTLIVGHFPEKEKKAHLYYSTKVEKSPGLWVMFQVKITVVSFQHIIGPHWQFVATFHSWLRNLTPESTECFSFLLKESIWHIKKRITSSWYWPELTLNLTQALNKSQIHWPLKVDIAKLFRQ